MKAMKTLAILAALFASSFLAAGVSLAASKAQVMQEGARQLEKLIGESESQNMMHVVELFKEAGLAYQPSLPASLKDTLSCKDQEQLRILVGVYAFDANYALLFGRKREFRNTGDFLRKDLYGRLNLVGKLKLKTLDPAVREKLAANPGDPANRALYVKVVAANMHAWIEAAAHDQEMMDLMVDSFYGGVIEALYLSCRLALASGGGEKVVELFNDQAERLCKAYRAVAVFSGHKDLSTLVEYSERQGILKPIIDLLRARKGRLNQRDIKKVLELVWPVRAGLVNPCR